MKAKEYFEKYDQLIITELKNGTSKHTKSLLLELSDEVEQLAKKRHIIRGEAFISIIKEINTKWNSICSMFEKKYGVSPLKWNGFKEFWKYEMPELRPWL